MASVEIFSLDELTRLTRNPADAQVASDANDGLWTRLLATAHDSKVSDKHLTAACNAVCFYIRTTSAAQTSEAKIFSTSTATWYQVFDVARRALVAGKSKPALQVLDTLTTLTGRLPQKQDAVDIVEEAVYEMATVIYTQQSKQSLKEACVLLHFFFKKLSDFMSPTTVLGRALEDSFATHHRLCASANTSTLELYRQDFGPHVRPWIHFIFSLLLAANVAESKSAALKLLSLLCTNNANLQFPDLIDITSKAIDVYSGTKASALDEITREILPAILVSGEKYQDFFANKIRSSDATLSKLEVALGVLVYGKSQSHVDECDLPNLCNEIALRFMTIAQACKDVDGTHFLLSHASSSVRLRALSLILASTSPNTALSADTLHRLVRGLPYLHNDTDAFYRGEILSIFRRFLTRLQYSYRILLKNQSETSVGSQHAYVNFCIQYWNFLASEISIHHSYGRNVLALETLRLITETFSSHPPFTQINLVNERVLSTLCQLTINPYDDIRMLSARVLQNVTFVGGLDSCLSPAFTDTLSFVFRLAARTNRADHADALGRLIALSQENGVATEHRVQQSESQPYNITELIVGLVTHIDKLNDFNVTSEFPLHGNLLGVKYVLDRMQSLEHASITSKLREEVLLIASNIWRLSQPHLCIDSPEVETDQSEEVDYRGPKDTLAYAWRALRDSSLLIQALLNVYGHDHGVISAVGYLCLDQLTQLRHRGAFSTVAQTFVICCQKSRASVSAETRSLISKWFNVALSELMNQAERLTRRSAGLPAMFVALLDPANSQSFNASISKLIVLAAKSTSESTTKTDKLQLPQVHALNCLKDIMNHSRFRATTEALVVPMIELAAQCLRSPIWAIKNCGLMLFRASINRLDPDVAVGTTQTGSSVQTSFYHGLRPIDVAFSLLAKPDSLNVPNGNPLTQKRESVADTNTMEPIFAGLDLLGRLYIKKSDKTNAIHYVSQHMSSHVWHVRARVARLLVDMTPPNEEASFMAEMLGLLNHCTNMNECHCRLLTVQGLLTRLRNASATLDYQERFTVDLAQISEWIWDASSGDNCALWLNIVDEIINLQSITSPWSERLKLMYQKRSKDALQKFFHPRALSDQALAYVLMRTYMSEEDISLDRLVQHISNDENVITHVFSQPLPPMISFVQFSRYYEIVLSILPVVKAEDARAAIIQATVMCLDLPFDLNTLNVEPLMQLITFDQHVTRAVLIPQLGLYTALCRTTWLRNDEVFTKLQTLSSAYCLHLKFAASDQVEDSTRWAAVRSLQQWQNVQQLDQMLHAIFDTTDELELFLTVYDLLNDDDEEIRAAAARIAVSFCRPMRIANQNASAACALASRELCLSRIVTAFSRNETFPIECLSRLLGCRTPQSPHGFRQDLVCYCQRYTVERRIAELTAVANDLFAEEKQNLYVCETEELNAWSRTLRRASCSIPDEISDALLSWVSGGLQSIQKLLNNHDNRVDMSRRSMATRKCELSRPLSSSMISLSQDLEVLILRVIVVANILVESESMLQATESIHENLKTLRLTCQELHLSNLITSAFTTIV